MHFCANIIVKLMFYVLLVNILYSHVHNYILYFCFLIGSEEEEDEAYKQCAFDDPCARRCIRSYMSRYDFLCKEDLGGKSDLTCEDYGRMHNGGGPSGCSQPRTLDYYVNVLMKHRCIEELSILNGDSQQETTTEHRSVTSGSLEDNSLVTAGVAEGDVTEGDVSVGAVTVGDKTEGAVTVGDVTEGAVTEGDMSDGNESIPVTNDPRSYSMQVMARLRKKLRQHDNNCT